MPAALLASGPRADGLRRFLEQELGMEVVCFAHREELSDLDDFYRELRGSEAALLFGSSFEQDGADELEIPLIRVDYPVFDEVCLPPPPPPGRAGNPPSSGGHLPRHHKRPHLERGALSVKRICIYGKGGSGNPPPCPT